MTRNRRHLCLVTLILFTSLTHMLNAEEIVKIHIKGPGPNAKYILEDETVQNPVTVEVGQTVRWINDEVPKHTATMLDSNSNMVFNTGTLNKSDEADILMDRELFELAGGTPGGTVELNYICVFHSQNMQGKILLKDNATPSEGILKGITSVSTESNNTAKVYSIEAVSAVILESFPPKALITATGTVPSTSWTNSRLIPYVYVTPPADGIYEFDFVADRPGGIAIPLMSQISTNYIYQDLAGVRGFRIYTSVNDKEVEIREIKRDRLKNRSLRRGRSTPAPDLPLALKSMLADEGVRLHHQLWHLVRSSENWNNLPLASQQELIQMGWQAPRFEDQSGAGLDFLFMHRQMIKMVNAKLATLNDPYWDRVTGWDPIPWAHDNTEWPVPNWPSPHPAAAWARLPTTVAQMESFEAQFRDPNWLQVVSLDQLGSEIEFSLHSWMHLRWSGPEPANSGSSDPSNDWLFTPWSSHVNKHFWKLHGWIDERIADWEAANNTTADFSTAWAGPPGVLPTRAHRANLRAKELIPSVSIQTIPMLPNATTIERLQRSVLSRSRQ